MRDPVSGSDPRGNQGSTVADLLAGTFGTLFVMTFGISSRDDPVLPRLPAAKAGSTPEGAVMGWPTTLKALRPARAAPCRHVGTVPSRDGPRSCVQAAGDGDC
jgi:hypothetical protein